VVAERRRLRALHVLEPFQVLARKLPEADATPAPLVGIALEHGLLGVVLPDEREHPLSRLSLGERARRRPTAPTLPAAVAVRLSPRPP